MAASRQHQLLPLAAWAGAWLATMTLAAFGPEYLWGSAAGLTWLAVLLNLAVGTGMIVANIRHLASVDEMMQRIQLEALAISLGVGVVGGLGYSVMESTNLIPFDAEIGHVMALIALVYVLALVVGIRRRC